MSIDSGSDDSVHLWEYYMEEFKSSNNPETWLFFPEGVDSDSVLGVREFLKSRGSHKHKLEGEGFDTKTARNMEDVVNQIGEMNLGQPNSSFSSPNETPFVCSISPIDSADTKIVEKAPPRSTQARACPHDKERSLASSAEEFSFDSTFIVNSSDSKTSVRNYLSSRRLIAPSYGIDSCPWQTPSCVNETSDTTFIIGEESTTLSPARSVSSIASNLPECEWNGNVDVFYSPFDGNATVYYDTNEELRRSTRKFTSMNNNCWSETDIPSSVEQSAVPCQSKRVLPNTKGVTLNQQLKKTVSERSLISRGPPIPRTRFIKPSCSTSESDLQGCSTAARGSSGAFQEKKIISRLPRLSRPSVMRPKKPVPIGTSRQQHRRSTGEVHQFLS